MKVVIVGAGFANKGAEAMLKTAKAQLEARLGPIEMVIWDAVPDHLELAQRAGFGAVAPTAPAGRAAKTAWLAGRIARHPGLVRGGIGGSGGLALLVRAKGAEMVELLGGFDGVVDASGFAYADGLGVHALTLVEPLARAAASAGKPYVYLPQAWGPFTDPHIGEGVRTLLGLAGAYAFARDSVSLEHLEGVCAREHCDARAHQDTAFAFEGSPAGRGESILREMGWSGERPVVGLAPNLRAYRRGDADAYLATLATIGRAAVDDLGADVVLQANEIKLSGNDDRWLCARAAEAIDRPGRTLRTDAALSAEDSKALVGQCGFMYASRYHSLVFALSQGVPCAALGWSHKYAELLRPFGLQDACLGVNESTEDGVRAALTQGWLARDETRRAILAQLPQVAKDNAVVFDAVADRLAGVRGSRNDREGDAS